MDTDILDMIDLRQLGQELQAARKKRGLTQEEAAHVIDVARTTITAIEKGERRIKEGELIKLARAYGCQVSDFVRPRPQVEPYEPQFRASYLRTSEDNQAIEPYVQMLEEHARDYLELEQLTKATSIRKYPPEYQITRLTEQAAESVALEERNRLGLGDGPIPILRDILEQDVGLRIFYLPMRPAKFSAIYFYAKQLGGCIAINSHHPEERRRWSLAHDYCHFLVDRFKPRVLVMGSYQRVPESERFADYFALYFLMPTSGLTRRFNDILQSEGKLTVGALCILAHYYGVSMEALTDRLEMMRILPLGTWERLRDGGFKVRDAQRKLGLGVIPARAEQLPMRYQYLALDAFNNALLTEGQLARFLHVDRLEARRIVEELQQQTNGIIGSRAVDHDLIESSEA